jgi:hypothetical protein
MPSGANMAGMRDRRCVEMCVASGYDDANSVSRTFPPKPAINMTARFPTALALATFCFSIFPVVVARSAEVAAPAGQFDFKLDGKLVARFMTAHDTSTPERRAETYKPYLHVFGPDGTRLTKGPGGTFPHHRGIFVGYNKIDVGGKKYDRWHMTGGDQVVTKSVGLEIDGRMQHTAEIDWEESPGKPLLKENRVLLLSRGVKPFYLEVELTSVIKPVAGEATLDGDPEHAGAQFRPSEKIELAKTEYLFPGENIDAHKDKDLPWAAEIFTVEGKTFTVAILNHPDNPPGTRYSAYRNYGRFGAFPVLKAAPGAPAKLHYKWVVAEGEVRDPAALQAEWNKFAGKNDPTPKLTTRPADQPAPKKPDAKKPDAKKTADQKPAAKKLAEAK